MDDVGQRNAMRFTHNIKSELFKREPNFDIVATYCAFAVLADLSAVACDLPFDWSDAGVVTTASPG